LNGKRHYHSLGTVAAREAGLCRDQLEETLRLVERGVLTVPLGADLGPFLVSGGKLNAAPELKAPFMLVELFGRYRGEHPDGVKASTTRSTEAIDVAHLLRLVGAKTAVATITFETLQRHVNSRASEEGRGGRTLPVH